MRSSRSSAEAAAALNAKYGEALEKEALGRVFAALSNGGQRITAATLHDALKKLQYKCSRKDVEDMIWEVDEDCDGFVSWVEL
jgi:calmodulin